ncbi:MAG: hypothetical protein KKE57_00485 [Proteobacteria bacterium]|nr:hypothetical protein [Pseudomonadota bacterium]
MSDREYIRSLVKEAALYRSQGLFAESRKKYCDALEFIANSEELCEQSKFIESIREKMQSVEEDLAETEQAVTKTDLSEDQQGLLKELFTFSKARETAAIEGAGALAQFGQYEKALSEFQRLIQEGILPIVAAKHVIRLYISLSLPDAAIARFKEWSSSSLFLKQDLEYIRIFLRDALEKSGSGDKIRALGRISSKRPREIQEEEEPLTITDVSIQLPEGSPKDQRVQFDVIDHEDRRISLIVPSDKRRLNDRFRTGARFPDIQCYSEIAIFNGSGVVTRKAKIEEGPSQGDYMVDINIEE